MGYFPFFIDIKNKRCLVVGGGIVALRKIEKLIPYEPKIKVISPEICSGIKSIKGLTLIQREFVPEDIEKSFLVIGATDSKAVNSLIYRLCSDKNILVNVVDDKEKCGFIFPALVKKNDISIGISTSGQSPILAKHLKDRINALLDEKTVRAQSLLSESRSRIKTELNGENSRKAAFEEILRQVNDGNESPDVDSIIEEIHKYENQNRNKEK